MDSKNGHVMTLANSIIGVSILAMPYCFQKCGILLSIGLLIVANGISRLTCHYLLKSAILSRRKTFEYLAYYTFGTVGKFFIEIGIIGFLLGSCIAFFVVMGDIGPEIVSEITGTTSTNTFRTSILMALALFCVLPLGLLRNVDSLLGVSKATVAFYVCLVSKIVIEALPQIYTATWYKKVAWWQPSGILQCMPIFSMALSCQTQLFEIYHVLPNATLEKMNSIIGAAVNICTGVYICVGLFGYIGFYYKPFTGNILVSFNPSTLTTLMKIGFILSLAFSFPLVIFPCRASLYSLLFKGSYTIHDGVGNYIPEGKFKALTMMIVFSSLLVGIMIPNIELVLGLVGSTIGIMICILFPVLCFICVSQKNTNERHLAQIVLVLGVSVMIMSTYANLYAMEKVALQPLEISSPKKDNVLETPNLGKPDKAAELKNNEENEQKVEKNTNDKPPEAKREQNSLEKAEVRHEPPQPIEVENEEEQIKQSKQANNAPKVEPRVNIKHEPPVVEDSKEKPQNKEDSVKKFVQEPRPVSDENKREIKESAVKVEQKLDDKENIKKSFDKIEEQIKDNIKTLQELTDNDKKQTNESGVIIVKPKLGDKNKLIKTERKNDEVDIEAIKKEDKELQEQESLKPKEAKIKEVLIDTIQKQNQVQKELVEQQKKILEVIEKHENLNRDELNTKGENKAPEGKPYKPLSYKRGIINVTSFNSTKKYYPLPLVLSSNKLKQDVNNNSNLTTSSLKVDANLESDKTKPDGIKNVNVDNVGNILAGKNRDILSDQLNRTKREALTNKENCEFNNETNNKTENKPILTEPKNEIEQLGNKIPPELLLLNGKPEVAESLLIVKSHTRDLKEFKEGNDE